MLLESMGHLAVGLGTILTGLTGTLLGVAKGFGVLLLGLLGVLLLGALVQGLFALLGIRVLAMQARRESLVVQNGVGRRPAAARPRWMGRRG